MKISTLQTIQKKAYDLWEANGKPNDRDLDHWLQAEQDIGVPGKSKHQPPARQAAGRKSKS